jgi:hypothetical protein
MWRKVGASAVAERSLKLDQNRTGNDDGAARDESAKEDYRGRRTKRRGDASHAQMIEGVKIDLKVNPDVKKSRC